MNTKKVSYKIFINICELARFYEFLLEIHKNFLGFFYEQILKNQRALLYEQSKNISFLFKDEIFTKLLHEQSTCIMLSFKSGKNC